MLEMAKNENGAKKMITLIITAFCSEHSNFCKVMVIIQSRQTANYLSC